jgi:lipoprotein NlpD
MISRQSNIRIQSTFPRYSTFISIVKFLIAVFLFSTISACADNNYAPVRDLEKPRKVLWGTHRIQPGETLYYIAWRYGRDYRELAAANNIPPPYLIKPGEFINLRAKPLYSARPAAPRKKTAKAEKRVTRTSVKAHKGRVSWSWPLKGTIISTFSASGVAANKGIDIKGKPGSSIKAAADGVVVYSGSGLIGYGNLVIVKHSDVYLSAYAHNKQIFVKERNNVKGGQKIAEIGSTGTTITKLHFEIRKNGKPVNPLKYLPNNQR